MKTIKTKIERLQKNDLLSELAFEYVDEDGKSKESIMEEHINYEGCIEGFNCSTTNENLARDNGYLNGHKAALKEVLALFPTTLEKSLVNFKEGDGESIGNLLLSEQLKLLRERQIEASEAIGKIELTILKNTIN